MPRTRLFLIHERPEIAAQWHPELNTELDLKTIGTGSHAMAYWRCEAGHTWSARVFSRTQGAGCPECAGYSVKARTTMAKAFPHLLTEWDQAANTGIDPQRVGPASHRRVWWRCSDGHRWQAEIANRTRGTGCPECRSGVEGTLETRDDLVAELAPHLRADVDVLSTPLRTNRHLTWRCASGHQWEARLRHRAVAGSGCPQCRGRRKAGQLSDEHPSLAREWDHARNLPTTLESVTSGSHRSAWWICQVCVTSFEAKVNHRVRGNSQCPACANRTIYGLLPQEAPDLIPLWHPERNLPKTADDTRAGAAFTAWWLCPEDKHLPWRAPVWQVFRGGRECPGCSLPRSSGQEIRLFAELEHLLPEGELNVAVTTRRRTWHLDMGFSAPDGSRILLEFDGSHWHKGRSSHDLAKSLDVEGHEPGSLHVIRLREEPLDLTRPTDLLLPFNARDHVAAALTLRHLDQLFSWPASTRERVRAYVRDARPRATGRAQELMAALSVGGSAPHAT